MSRETQELDRGLSADLAALRVGLQELHASDADERALIAALQARCATADAAGPRRDPPARCGPNASRGARTRLARTARARRGRRARRGCGGAHTRRRAWRRRPRCGFGRAGRRADGGAITGSTSGFRGRLPTARVLGGSVSVAVLQRRARADSAHGIDAGSRGAARRYDRGRPPRRRGRPRERNSVQQSGHAVRVQGFE